MYSANRRSPAMSCGATYTLLSTIDTRVWPAPHLVSCLPVDYIHSLIARFTSYSLGVVAMACLATKPAPVDLSRKARQSPLYKTIAN